MYYEESTQLIESNPFDKGLIIVLDREVAHAYAPGGGGFTELPLLVQTASAPYESVERLMAEYERLGVVESYQQVECPCGERYDGREPACPECSSEVANARETGVTRYAVKKQPKEPAFDPDSQPKTPDVFISYRHADAETLATDIYYSLRDEGLEVFLDRGEIAVGADPAQVYLRAASAARFFIVLVSDTYFDSPFCRKEIAHAARMRRRLIRVNLSPDVPNAPPQMPWLGRPNWLNQEGDGNRFTPALDSALKAAVRTPSGANVADLRLQACVYLMQQLSRNEIDTVWNSLSWMFEFDKKSSKEEKIEQIMQQVTTERLQELCDALAP
jgi:hypothetical protein